jgi:hypothetical protein
VALRGVVHAQVVTDATHDDPPGSPSAPRTQATLAPTSRRPAGSRQIQGGRASALGVVLGDQAEERRPSPCG